MNPDMIDFENEHEEELHDIIQDEYSCSSSSDSESGKWLTNDFLRIMKTNGVIDVYVKHINKWELITSSIDLIGDFDLRLTVEEIQHTLNKNGIKIPEFLTKEEMEIKDD